MLEGWFHYDWFWKELQALLHVQVRPLVWAPVMKGTDECSLFNSKQQTVYNNALKVFHENKTFLSTNMRIFEIRCILYCILQTKEWYYLSTYCNGFLRDG